MANNSETDREILIRLQKEINHQLESTCPDIPPEVIPPDPPEGEIIPPEMEGNPPKGANWDGWIWPVPFWAGKDPVISDPFNRHETEDDRQHLGTDIAFKNDSAEIPDIPENTKWYHMPSSTVPMLAMGPGNIWFAGLTSMGWTIKIDHHDYVGFPLNTYYTHMSESFVSDWNGKDGMKVFPGMQLGYIGNSPAGPNDLNHCHNEMLDYSEGVPDGRVNRALDPGEFLPYFGKLILPVAEVGLIR